MKEYRIKRYIVLTFDDYDTLIGTGKLRTKGNDVLFFSPKRQTWLTTNNTIGMIQELMQEGRVEEIK